MITALGIWNFKRFRAVDLALRPLTVLTGLNGTGKTSAIQALLLARRAAEDDRASAVPLNGPFGLALGQTGDVLNMDAEGERIEVALATEQAGYRYVFDTENQEAPYLPIVERPPTAPWIELRDGTAFTYLMAERLGPRDLLSVTSEEDVRVGVGEQGQFTAQALALHETKTVNNPALLHRRTDDHGVMTLRTQVEEWASEIIGPVRITAQWLPGVAASVIRFQTGGFGGEPIKPANMGFGFSYALPVIVASLLVRPSGTLIVENPEAHLHPAGQSRLGRFLGRVAGAGVQVIVETHSDHVLNGVRLAVVEDGSLSAGNVVMHFLGDAETPETIDVTALGALSRWPTGFFDQLDEDLGRLARVRRPGELTTQALGSSSTSRASTSGTSMPPRSRTAYTGSTKR